MDADLHTLVGQLFFSLRVIDAAAVSFDCVLELKQDVIGQIFVVWLHVAVFLVDIII